MKLFVLRTVYFATAVPGTVLFVSGLLLWGIADACEQAAQPYLRTDR